MIPYGYHWLDEQDVAAVAKALRAEWITQGPLVEEFERRVAAACGARFGVAFASGTAGLHAACFAAGIQSGDEVITTALTFVATPNAVVYQGATPVFSDIDPRTLLIDPSEVARRATSRTKAILPVHFAGLPCPMGPLEKMARERGWFLIEDAAHALGAIWRAPSGRWEKVGSCSHSDMAVLSFHPVKHITTGEGGMVLTNRPDLEEKLRLFRHHGIHRRDDSAEPWRQEMVSLGYNYRISDFQCALGLNQLGKLEGFLKRREQIALAYEEAFRDVEELICPFRGEGEARHAWHLYPMQLNRERFRVDRGEIFRALRQEGIGVQVHYLPVPLHSYYRERFGFHDGDYPHAEAYYQRAITLPLFPRMTDAEVDRVIRAVRGVVEKFRKPWISSKEGSLTLCNPKP